MPSLLTILIVVLLLSLLFGGYGSTGPRHWGYTGWSPAALVVIVLLVCWALGILR